MSKKKYNKAITLEYQYQDNPESEQLVEEVFSKIFSHLIQEKKKLIAYFNSDSFKCDYACLKKKKSILVDFLSIH